MPLNYALFENHLTSDPDDYMAVVQSESTKSLDDVINLMISRGSTVTKAEVYSVLEEYSLAFETLLKEGYSINTPLFNIKPSIGGVFIGQLDSFHQNRHYIKWNVNLGARLKGISEQISVQKVNAAKRTPLLMNFKDIASDTRNENATPNGVGHLTGSMLKFDIADALQGIFFIKSDGTAIKAITLIKHKPGELIFMIPALPAGSYTLAVRSIFQNGKELREGQLGSELIVV